MPKALALYRDGFDATRPGTGPRRGEGSPPGPVPGTLALNEITNKLLD